MILDRLTLWDLLPAALRPSAPAKPPRKARPKPAREPAVPPPSPPRAPIRAPATNGHTALSMRERYELMTRAMLAEHGVRVRKWRTHMSGVAWQVTYHDGKVARLIESPRPRGPVSASIFLHEIGHHAIGFGTYSPRCLEEYHAWMFALAQMERWKLNVTAPVHLRVRDSLRYAVAKAERRGLKRIPRELEPYLVPYVEPRSGEAPRNQRMA